MDDQPHPYIPLSWLRHQRKWAREFVKNECLDDHDLWLLTVRQEIDRLVIIELYDRLHELVYIVKHLKKQLGIENWPGEEITTLTKEEWERAYLGEPEK